MAHAAPRLLGLAGWSGSGKTTLMVALIAALQARGVTVSTIKHAHHAFDVDKPGKDSHRHREAGAVEVAVSSANRWALMHELRGAPEARLDEIVARMSPVDIILVEGFKSEAHDKIEVYRQALGKPLLAPGDPHVVALASDGPVADAPMGLPADLPRLDLNDADAIAAFVIERYGLSQAAGAA